MSIVWLIVSMTVMIIGVVWGNIDRWRSDVPIVMLAAGLVIEVTFATTAWIKYAKHF